jgi:uncharacterized protein YjbI with pentapeptide repeats
MPLAGCDLFLAQFHSVDLSGVNLSGANLTGALFFDSVLTGADLNGADLTGVRWRAAICPDGTNADDAGGSCCRNLNGAVPAAGC